MWDATRIDLGHNPDRTGYNGLEHASCNRAAGNRSARRRRVYYVMQVRPVSRW